MGPTSTLRAWGLPLLLAVAGVCGVADVDGASLTSAQLQKVFFEAPGADSALECVPSQVPSGDRCHYINANWEMCQVSSGLVPYLYIHYCCFTIWPWLSVVLMVAWVLVLFCVLMVAADRFFCPALEVIADYLEIPPDVAGATLLAFGNGAPDLFTQMAAISSGDEQGLAMALGEPIGGGLFVSNVVLAIVILASPTASFRVEPWPFLRDSVAYTGSVLLVIGLTTMGTVAWWSCAILLAYYGLYVVVILLSKGATEPTHIEQSKHFQEVVSEPGHLRVLESLQFSPLARPNMQRAKSEPAAALPQPLPASESTPETCIPPAPLSLPASPRYLQGQPPDCASSTPSTAAPANGMQLLPAAPTAASTASSMLSSSAEAAPSSSGLLGEAAAATEEGGRAATSKAEVVACSDAAAARAAAGTALQVSLSFADWDGEDAPAQGGGAQPRASALQQPLLPPQPAGGERTALCIPVAAAVAAAELDSEAPMQEGQAEEQAACGTPGYSAFAVLKAPIVLVLRLTMPEVGMDNDVNYPKVFAVLLPVCAPLFVVLVKRVAFTEFGINGLLYGLCCSAFSTSIIWSIYPSDGRHYGVLSGVFTVMTFLIAIIWLNVAAGEVVATSRALGYVFGFNQDILGATVLAWGNSVPDMVADVTMARDGFPSMALAACFASPMFALTIGSAASWGSRIFATGSSISYSLRPALLMGLVITCVSMLRFIATVPLLHRWRMVSAVAALSLVIYTAFQCGYLYLELRAPSSSGGGSATDLPT